MRRYRREDIDDKPTRYFSSKQENNVAKKLHMKVQPNSGATMYKKGDVVDDNWLIECKTTMSPKKSFSIKKEWLEKNKEEQIYMNKEFSALMFNFGPNESNYVVIDEDTFKLLKDLLEES